MPTEVNDLDNNIEPIKTLEAGLLNQQADELAVGADKMCTKEMGVDEIGAYELGADKTGADETGVYKTDTDKTDADEMALLPEVQGPSPETVDSEDQARELVTEDEQDTVNDNDKDSKHVSLVLISDHLN
jgi:hypothetical protein